MLHTLEKLPTALSSFILRVFLVLIIFGRIVRSLVWNLLLLAVVAVLLFALYIILGDLEFSSVVALRTSIGRLPSDYKTALISSLITIVGFIVAFRTAAVNWKQQFLASLKTEAAGEIEVVYSEVSGLITSARLFAESVIRAVDSIKSHDRPLEESLFSVQWVIQNLPDFVQTRNRISALSVQVYRLIGKHSLLLTSVWGAQEKLYEANKAFGKVAHAIWVPLPFLNPQDPQLLDNFLMQVDVKQYQSLIAACEETYGFVGMASGAVRGLLLSPLVRLSLPAMISILRNKRILTEYFSTFSKKDAS